MAKATKKAVKQGVKRGRGRPPGSKNKQPAQAPAPEATGLSALAEASIVTSMTGAMEAMRAAAAPKGIVKSLLLVPVGTRVVLEAEEKSETYPVIALALLDTGNVVPVVHDTDAKTLVVLPADGVPVKAWLNPGE
jgi:hypothetical protein